MKCRAFGPPLRLLEKRSDSLGGRIIEPGVFTHPAVTSLALPAFVVLALVLAFRLGLSREPAMRYSASALGLGFLAAYLAILGLPPLPPQSASHKLLYIALGGLALGVVLDLARDPLALRGPLLMALPAGALYWLGQNRLTTPFDTDTLVLFAALLSAAWVVMLRLDHLRKGKRGLDALVLLGVACVGLAVLMFLGKTASLAQLALALGVALGAGALWNWLHPRFVLAGAFLFGPALAFLALADIAALFSQSSKFALPLLLPVLFADLVARRIATGQGLLARATAPVVLALTALVPVGAAIGIAWFFGQY
jgi:hypothetical protein